MVLQVRADSLPVLFICAPAGATTWEWGFNWVQSKASLLQARYGELLAVRHGRLPRAWKSGT